MTLVDAPVPEPADQAQRPPVWRDVRVLRVVLQLAFAVGVVGLVAYLYSNLTTNLQAQGIRTDFGYLDQPAGFQILGSDFRASQTVGEALRVGLRNTISVAAIGIVLTTVLGVIVGIASLSTNWLVRKAATVYVETLRNLPPLLVIVFTFTVVILPLPRIENPGTIGDIAIITNRAIAFAAPAFEDGAWAYVAWLVAALVIAGGVGAWRSRRNAATGEPHHRILWGTATFSIIAVIGWFALDQPIVIDYPEVIGRQLEGGWTMSANYAAILLALVVYTASYIAEIVRGSIQAVPKGQNEAAEALALGAYQRLRYVTLPLAFRIAVPSIANQYLNLTKNSSLATAVGFVDITAVTVIVIGNGNPAPQSIILLMLAYLSLSLLIALFTNLANRRLQLVTR